MREGVRKRVAELHLFDQCMDLPSVLLDLVIAELNLGLSVLHGDQKNNTCNYRQRSRGEIGTL